MVGVMHTGFATGARVRLAVVAADVTERGVGDAAAQYVDYVGPLVFVMWHGNDLGEPQAIVLRRRVYVVRLADPAD